MLGSGPLLRRRGKRWIWQCRMEKIRFRFHEDASYSLLVLPPSLLLFLAVLCLQFISVISSTIIALLYIRIFSSKAPLPLPWGHTSRYRTNPTEPRVAVNAKQSHIKSPNVYTPLGLGLGLWEHHRIRARSTRLLSNTPASPARSTVACSTRIWGVDMGDKFAG